MRIIININHKAVDVHTGRGCGRSDAHYGARRDPVKVSHPARKLQETGRRDSVAELFGSTFEFAVITLVL